MTAPVRRLATLLLGCTITTLLAVHAPSTAAAATAMHAPPAAPAQQQPPPEPAPEPPPQPAAEPDPGGAATPPLRRNDPVPAPGVAEARPSTQQQAPGSPQPPPPVPPGVLPQADNGAAEARARAAELARDRIQAAAELARKRVEAAERLAEMAAEADRIQASWEERGRPNKMIVVRSKRIDVVAAGRVSRQVPLRPGAVTLGSLDRHLPPEWLTITDGTAQLFATIVMTPGTALDVTGITTLKLAGGATTPEAASIYTGRGRLTLRGVTVASIDPATGQPVPPAPGRPSIAVSAGGILEATDTTITDLGSPPVETDNGRAGLAFGPGSRGTLIRTTLLRNTTGLELSRSDAVRLHSVTVGDSTADGIVLHGDRGTTMSDIRTERNRGNGVLVSGESTDRRITGISTAANGAFGVAVVGQRGAQIIGVATAADKIGGLRLSRSVDTVVTAFTATEQPIGVFTHVNTTNIVLDHLQTTGGRRGVVAEKSTRSLTVTESRLQGARVAGLAIGGQNVALTDVQVIDSGTGVRVERGAKGITITRLQVERGRDGIVATPGTSGVVVRDLVADHVQSDAVRTFSPNTQIIGGQITGGSTGIDAGAATTISGTSISGADEGIHSSSAELVHADGVDVHTTALGINAATGSPFLLTASRIRAVEALRGQIAQQGTNELSLPALNLLSAIGVPLILLAIVLEQVHARLYRRAGSTTGRRLPPVMTAEAG